nr:hypothetical protein [uncultured Neisseria sp.]
MSEPIITPAAIYTFGGVVGAGHLLGMPVDAVALGAVASAAVTMISEPKSRWLVVAYTIIGGLLGGAFAPPLTHFLIGEAIGRHPSLGEQRLQLAHVFAPVVVGLLWQVLLKFARTVWPSFENHADDIVEWLLNLLLRRPKK